MFIPLVVGVAGSIVVVVVVGGTESVEFVVGGFVVAEVSIVVVVVIVGGLRLIVGFGVMVGVVTGVGFIVGFVEFVRAESSGVVSVFWVVGAEVVSLAAESLVGGVTGAGFGGV